jgi:hypothetical protein
LAAPLNDPRRSRISDPRKNAWVVTFPTTEVHELARLAKHLDALGVVFQTNYGKAELGDRPERAFLTIYDRESQERLLDAVKDVLKQPRLRLLEDLVAARGPIPPEILTRMTATIRIGRSYEYLADALNRNGIIAGMGGRRWTPAKVRRALDELEGPTISTARGAA